MCKLKWSKFYRLYITALDLYKPSKPLYNTWSTGVLEYRWLLYLHQKNKQLSPEAYPSPNEELISHQSNPLEHHQYHALPLQGHFTNFLSTWFSHRKPSTHGGLHSSPSLKTSYNLRPQPIYSQLAWAACMQLHWCLLCSSPVWPFYLDGCRHRPKPRQHSRFFAWRAWAP